MMNKRIKFCNILGLNMQNSMIICSVNDIENIISLALITSIDHFPLPFINIMLEHLSRHMYYRFLDGMLGCLHIPIVPKDKEKTTFTCPYGTFSYRRMPFGLCNELAKFQRCIMSIFDEFIKDIIEVFMDNFSVFGDSFEECLHNLEKVLSRCEETNLVINSEKCYFMV